MFDGDFLSGLLVDICDHEGFFAFQSAGTSVIPGFEHCTDGGYLGADQISNDSSLSKAAGSSFDDTDKGSERGCCLTYNYVNDKATELLGEKDLDMISALGGLVTSRVLYFGISHRSALQGCLEHAKHWLQGAHHPIVSGSAVTYAYLREKLNKIMSSDYCTTTPEMRAPVDVATAVSAGNNYEIRNMIVEAMSQVGKKGVVTLEEGKSAENILYVVEGMQFDRGYISPYFVTDSKKMSVEFENFKVASC